MKLKVLLVDDEKLERVLIRKGYDWEENEFEIIGEASNGEEALEFFDRKQPDIVFTDINMPYMDGLALAEQIKKRSEKCRVVIITGYREFDYARRALKLGVKDFILKPVNVHEIVALAENIREELMKEEGYNREYNQLKETASKNQDIIMESFLQRLVENHIEEEEAIHKLQMYSFDMLMENCICMNIKPYLSSEQLEEDTLVHSKRILKLIQEHPYHYTVAFVHYLCNIIVYFHNENMEQILDMAIDIKNQINEQLKLDTDIGISQLQQGFSGISKAYHQAEKAISASIIVGKNSCITYEEYAELKKSGTEPIDIDWNEFELNMAGCMKKRVEEQIDEFTMGMKKAGVADIDYLKLMSMNMLAKASGILTKHGKSLGQLVGEGKLYEEVAKIENVEDMNRCLKQFIHEILEFNGSTQKKKGNKLITQILEHIDVHLNEPTLTLKTIAKTVYANESYISRIFKQEMGESLIEYITRKRIERGRILMNTTDLKVYEIAEQVGFSDPHYFSICFKKQLGVTIKEYKNQI